MNDKITGVCTALQKTLKTMLYEGEVKQRVERRKIMIHRQILFSNVFLFSP